MAQRREDQRNEKLWDKTFTDNQDIDKEGHLSRMAHRKQSTHNAQITTILIVLIIILAATPVLYWVNHQQSFNHPQRTVKVASSSTATSKKKASSTSSSASVSKGKQASSSSSVSKAPAPLVHPRWQVLRVLAVRQRRLFTQLLSPDKGFTGWPRIMA